MTNNKRSFAVVWLDLQKLKGKTVLALARHDQNKILDFGSNGMLRQAQRPKNPGGEPSWVPKRQFEKVWEMLIMGIPCKRNKRIAMAIVYACLAYLPEVEYRLNPETLYLSDNRHPFGEVRERKG